MRLLIITQKVAKDDPILGFFHRWIKEFAMYCENIIVVCLEKRETNLPKKVRIYSLGKENGQSKLKYLFNFYKYLWLERKNYDAVLVHMNQEYILLAGWWWRLTGKQVAMWRNHHAGSWLTDVAAWFCHKIFCTSRYSYTKKYPKTVLMPVGIDTDLFYPDSKIEKIPRSILFLSRIAPVKKPDVLLDALKLLRGRGVDFKASFYGDALPQDQGYYDDLKQKAKEFHLDSMVDFYSGVPNDGTPAIYRKHQIFVNLSSSGMYDKTIFEAAACGTLSVNSNLNLRDRWPDLTFPEGEAAALSEKLAELLFWPITKQEHFGRVCREFVISEQSLHLLAERLIKEFLLLETIKDKKK